MSRWISAREGFRLILGLAISLSPLASATPVFGQMSDADFAACTVRLKQEAQTAGISADVSNDVLNNVQWIERVIELDRQQPEFTTTFSDYYRKRVTPARVEKGREMLKEHAELLRSIRDRYGVPAHYLVSFWGLETNFGRYLGKMAIPDSLATLACDERRSKFFTAELISAMRIIEAGDVSRESMIGSWAGAMGHVQFMPSAFLRYAVDGDGDGRRDLWGSIPDALASAGNFLATLGWQPGLRWGREVVLPAGFDYAQATRDIKQPLEVWSQAGVTDAFGGRLPDVDLLASILVPGGSQGPAFVVYHNFDVIMRWNRSEFYALDDLEASVGFTQPRQQVQHHPQIIRQQDSDHRRDAAEQERSGAYRDLSRLNETRWATGLSTQLKQKDRPLCAHNDGRLKRLSGTA